MNKNSQYELGDMLALSFPHESPEDAKKAIERIIDLLKEACLSRQPAKLNTTQMHFLIAGFSKYIEGAKSLDSAFGLTNKDRGWREQGIEIDIARLCFDINNNMSFKHYKNEFYDGTLDSIFEFVQGHYNLGRQAIFEARLTGKTLKGSALDNAPLEADYIASHDEAYVDSINKESSLIKRHEILTRL